MSRRAVELLEEWVGENAARPVAGAPKGDDSEARLRAEQFLIAAKDEGIVKQDIEEEVGDVVAYMSAAIANVVNDSDSDVDVGNTQESRKQRIRTRAFYIWLDEGCPEGCADIHWDMATELIAIEERTMRSR
jgi:DUF2934 family protein